MSTRISFEGPRVLGPALAVSLALALGACGDSEKHPPGHTAEADSATAPAVPVSHTVQASRSPDVDACRLVTAQEATAILGELRDSPARPTPKDAPPSCTFATAAGATLTLEVYGSAQWDLQRNLDSGDTTGVLDLGDEAYFVLKGSETHLWARKAALVLHVVTTLGSEKAKAMAAKAVSRL